MLHAVKALTGTGWSAVEGPLAGRLRRNQQLMVLRVPGNERRVRLSVYKVTGSGRSRPGERRIEITTTYLSGLPRLSDYEDVVLGFDAPTGTFVGVDPRRLAYGGETSNASTFFDSAGLDWSDPRRILVRVRNVRLFDGTEYHAFFKPIRLAEYIFNQREIHSGIYNNRGPFSGRTRSRAGALSVQNAGSDMLILEYPRHPLRRSPAVRQLVEAAERGDEKRLRRAKLSPAEYLAIQRRCEENGQIGEQFVVREEWKRLRRAGRNDLATMVKWVSQLSVGEGYDILSFETDGTSRLIEVKATSGTARTFEMTRNEWTAAQRQRAKYCVYRVVDVRRRPRIAAVLRDPVQLESDGNITRSPSGWLIETA